jgi:hypothetical protein
MRRLGSRKGSMAELVRTWPNHPSNVMSALGGGIRVFLAAFQQRKAWMAGTSPISTKIGLCRGIFGARTEKGVLHGAVLWF